MARTYPDFIEDARRFDFYHVGKDRWDYLERDGYRKLSTVLQKSKDIDWKRLYVFYHDMYILVQYVANYDEKYDGEGSKCCNDEMLTEDGFEKLVEENMDNPYINWSGIYYYIEERYRGREDYLDRFQKNILWVLYKYRKQLNQKSNSNYW